MMTPTDIIRTAQSEPITLIQSVSRSWHVLRELLDNSTYARTDCHREVKVKAIDTCTVADVAHDRKPTSARGHTYPKFCCECRWTEAAFGTAWEVVVAETCLRAATGILEADQREMANAWGVPVSAVEAVLRRLTFHRGMERLRYERVEDESIHVDGSHWGSYFLKK